MSGSRGHLDAQQAADLALGRGHEAARRHVRDCDACAAEVAALRALSGRGRAPGACPDGLVLARRHAGELPPARSAGVDEHVAACAGCALDLEALETACSEAPPGGVLTSVADAIRRALDVIRMPTPQPVMVHARGAAARTASDLEDALALHAAGDHAGAAARLEQVIAAGDSSSEARLFLGACLLELGRPRDAVIALRESVARARRDPEASLLLARALLESDDVAAARAELERASRLPGARRADARAAAKILAGLP